MATRLSDTEIQSYVRASTAVKITLKSPTIDSKTIFADCNCPLSKKGQFCKHIWATLIVTEQRFPDFIEEKTDLEKASAVFTDVNKAPAQNQAKLESQEAYKLKQNQYRKEQYQRQKQRLKDQKNSAKDPKRKSVLDMQFPAAVESALKYFSQNGFELKESITVEAVGHAKKKLSRVFHPDVGGTHDEIQELNKFAEILTKYSKS